MAKAKAKTADEKAGKTVRVVTETVEHREEPADELDLDPPEGDGDGEEDEDRDALAELEELAGSGARYEVRRTSPSGFTGYVGTYPRDTFTPDLLRTEWGGGNFTLRVKNSKGVYVGSRQIVLAGEAHHKREVVAPVASAPAGGMDGGLAAVLSSINASNEARAKAADAQTKLLTDLVIGLINKPAPVLPAAPDPLAMIAALKDVLKPDKGDSGADAVKLLLQGVNLGKDMGGEKGEAGIADVLMKGFDTISSAVAATPVPAARPAPRPAVRRLPAPGTVPAAEGPANSPAAPAPAVTTEEPAAMNQLQQYNWLKKQVLILLNCAHKGKDPELYAEVFLDNLPSFLTPDMVLAQMQAGDAVAKLASVDRRVASYAEWFEEFRAAVVEQLTAPEETDEETAGAELEGGPEAPDEGGETGEEFPGGDGSGEGS